MSSGRGVHLPLGPPEVHEVADSVFAYVQPDGSWWINNTGFIVGRHGVTSIDSCATEARTTAYLAALGKVSDLPVRTLVNTHHHGDHTYGNSEFRDALIVAHRECRAEMLAAGLPGERMAKTWDPPTWGVLELAPPALTYEHEVQLWVDDLLCDVRHVGVAAHTTNDSIVWIPERSVLFSGDLLFKDGTPFVLAGSLTGAIAAVSALAELGATTIVPGHGPVCGAEVIDEVLGYLRFVDDLARKAVEAGVTPLEAARETDLGCYADLLDAERIVGNLHRACAERRGAACGAAIDRAAALADMVSFNGGRPLTCLA